MFTVDWIPAALNDLTEIWLASDGNGRKTVNAAVNRIDFMLKNNPREAGEGRSGIDRILFEVPLSVVFEVHENQQSVRIREVRPVRRRSS